MQKPIKRLWISSVTDKAIREGFAKLCDGRKYNDLYAAAVSRAEADWLVGINATRALTCKYNAQLSCGRADTDIGNDRKTRRRNPHISPRREYYGLQVQAGKFSGHGRIKSQEFRSFSKERIETISSFVSNEKLSVKKVEAAEKEICAGAL